MDQLFLFVVLVMRKFKGDDYRDAIITAYYFLYMIVFMPLFGLIVYFDLFFFESNFIRIEDNVQSRVVGRLIFLPIILITSLLFFRLIKKKKVTYLNYIRKKNPFSIMKIVFFSFFVILAMSSMAWLPFLINAIVTFLVG